MCDLLTVSDSKMIGVALDALENILKVGQQKQMENGLAENPVVALVEQADALQRIEALQEDPNEEVYQKAVRMLETYFPLEDDANAADAGDSMGQAGGFNFGAAMPQGGFNFAA